MSPLLLLLIPLTVPEDLQAPIVEAIGSDIISVNFSEPLQPNGVIVSYTIFL